VFLARLSVIATTLPLFVASEHWHGAAPLLLTAMRQGWNRLLRMNVKSGLSIPGGGAIEILTP